MRFADVVFLDPEDVDALHDELLDRHGGSAGVRDRGLLVSAVMAPRSGYYDTLAELAAVLCYGLAKNHAYVDGNKRIAITAAAAFLGANGYPIGAVDVETWEAIVVGVADGTVTRAVLVASFAAAMGGDPVGLVAE